MTIAVYWDVKQQNKQINLSDFLLVYFKGQLNIELEIVNI